MTSSNSNSVPQIESSLRRALEHVEQSLGKDNVSRFDLGGPNERGCRRNVSLHRPRDVHAVVRPSSVDDVREVVCIFDRFRPGSGLHAISTGRNWGLGSFEPATDGVVTP
ncbi:MAG: hypothetical protein CBARDMAM_5931 [uncultured Caballeronia sp.]|nr:MAG: hypothetical protein CBARDMAM_5931 [uncultured Caballeronia sp.]